MGKTDKDIKEIPLPGQKLSQDTVDINLIQQFGQKLYKDNEKFIKEHIDANWFAVIEPTSGMLIASIDQNKLYQYTKDKYSGKLLYFMGLIKNNLIFQYV